jgi:predicted AAA+ superfamily ATPase
LSDIYPRLLNLPPDGSQTFFLWGPRQTGKSTLLKSAYPNAFWVDLLLPEEYRRYLERPQLLVDEARLSRPRFVVIDEIQKVPGLLDAVHYLHENEGVRFALCGSSARKVRKGQANLLGGRGLTYELFGLSAREIGGDFDLERLLNHGYLPPHYQSEQPQRLLNTYVANYLKEEIAAEGLVRRLPAFSGFLSAAALSDCEVVNHTTIGRETGVSGQTIRGYFDILGDTLLGRFLPSYRHRPKRRTVASPKFYFADVGVVNFLARRGWMAAGSELFGKAFENWIFHELCASSAYRDAFAQFSYWRLPSGIEVDFVVNHMDCAIEAKSTIGITDRHLKGLRELATDHPEVRRRVVVSLDEKDRMSADGIEILHYTTFLDRLWRGELFTGNAAPGP